jgi:stearoyl-CoA desaturase (delta-9 desaturase)
VFFLTGLGIGWLVTGEYMGGVQFGLSLLVWGVLVRTVVVWHITWSVNSITHLWGYRNYETGENSRNNWFVALVSNGEGWHNNHHADQRSAAHGHRWWEFDVTYITIRMLRLFRLARDVVMPTVKLPEPRPTS